MPIFSAGSASVSIVPDFTQADADIRAWFARQGDLTISVRPNLDQSALDGIRTQLAGLNATVNVDPNLDNTKLDAIRAQLGGLDAKVGISPDLNNAELALIRERLDSLHGTATVSVDKNALASSISQGFQDALKLSGLDKLSAAATAVIAPAGIATAVGALTELGAVASSAVGALALLPAGLLALAAPLAVIKLGTENMGAAFKLFSAQTPAQVKAAQDALDKLAPSAREVVLAVGALQPAFHDLQLSVQQQLFAGVGTEITSLGHVALPIMKTGLDGVAASLNSGLLASMRALSTDGASFTTIFANINTAGHTLAGTMAPLVQAFVQMATVGSQFLPEIAAGFSKAALAAADWVQKASASGQLTVIIQNAINVIIELGKLLVNVGSIIFGIFQAAIPFGTVLLGQLVALTGGLAKFVHSADGQTALTSFFSSINQVAAALLPAIQVLVQTIVASVLPVIGQLAAVLAPVIAQLAIQLAGAVRLVAPLFIPLAQVVAALVSAISPLIPQLGQIINTLLPPLTKILAELAPVLGQITSLVADALLKAAAALAPYLAPIGDAFVRILQAVVPLIPVITNLAIQLLPPLLAIVVALAPVLAGTAEAFAKIVTAVVGGGLAPVLVTIANVLSAVLVPILGVMADHINLVIAALVIWQTVSLAMAAVNAIQMAGGVGALIVQIAIWIGSLNVVRAATVAWTAVQWLLNAALDANPIGIVVIAVGALIAAVVLLATHWTTVVGALTTGGKAVLDFFTGPFLSFFTATLPAAWDAAWSAMSAFFTTIWNAIRSTATTVWTAMSSFFDTTWAGVGTVWSTVWNAASAFFNTIWNAIRATATTVWTAIASFFTAAWATYAAAWQAFWNAASAFFTTTWNAIRSTAQTIWTAIASFFTAAWAAFTAAWQAFWNAALAFFTTTWNTIFATAQRIWNAVQAFFNAAWAAFTAAWQAFWNAASAFFTTTWNAISATAQRIWTALQAFWNAAWAAFTAAWNAFWNAASAFFTAIWTAIQATAQRIWTAIQAFWNAAWAAFTAAWNAFWNAASAFFTAIWNTIQNTARTVWTAIASFFTGAWAAFTGAWNAVWNSISATFTNVWNGIKAFAVQVWNDIKAAIATPINFVIGTILNNGLFKAWDAVNDFLGLPFHINPLPTIPGFATGGYTGNYGMFGTGGTEDPAGVVHAREFVFTANQVANAGGPDAMYAMASQLDNGYANGGYVKLLPGYAAGGYTYPAMEQWVLANIPGAVITSDLRPGAADYHGLGEAVDFSFGGDPQSLLMPAAAKVAASWHGITELIHNPNESIKNGAVVPPSFWGAATWAQHANHVHWAMTPEALAGGAGGGPGGVAGAAPTSVSILGQIISGAGDILNLLTNSITGPVGQLIGQFKNSEWVQILAALPKKLLSGLWDKASGSIGTILGSLLTAPPPSIPGLPNGAVGAGTVQAIVQNAAATHGWGTGAEWAALSNVINHESSWNPTAQNPTSTAYGLFQFLDSTWATVGSKKTSDPASQAIAGMNYIQQRYGDPVAAWNHELAFHWFDQGGWLPPGSSMVHNGTGSNELVLNPSQQGRLAQILGVGASSGGNGPSSQPVWQFYLGDREITDLVDARVTYWSGADSRNIRSSQ